MEDDTAELPHVDLVFIGPCGCGKSTVAGRLIADSAAIDRESLERLAGEARASGQESRCYAWILDKLRCERERGGTMYVSLWPLASRRCRFTIIDAPGHNDFAKDIVIAMSQADIAVLVVPAVLDDLAVGQECEGQIREHTLLAYTLGLRRLVVCVNKMDSEAVSYSKDNFDRACAVVSDDLQKAGLKTHDVYFDVHFVPTSGWRGDNIISRSENTPWYCGPTLVEALDDAVASHFKPERPLRFSLREVMKVGGTGVVAVGRVATGSMWTGMQLLFVPGNVCTKVRAITKHHEALQEAVCGDVVSMSVDVSMNELSSGMVASAVDDNPVQECSSFLAQVIILSPPRAAEITAGCTLWVSCHASQVPCIVEELLSRTDRRTGQVLEMQPESLHAGDAAVVRLRPEEPICVEPFEEYPPLGRFTVRDQKVTVALGVVQQVEHVAGPEWTGSTSVNAKRQVGLHRSPLAKTSAATKPRTPSGAEGRAAGRGALRGAGSSGGRAQLRVRFSVDDSGEESGPVLSHRIGGASAVKQVVEDPGVPTSFGNGPHRVAANRSSDTSCGCGALLSEKGTSATATNVAGDGHSAVCYAGGDGASSEGSVG